MSEFIIYHNPRCSKSRQTLQLLQDKTDNILIKNYISEPLSTTELKSLLKKLNLKANDLIRKKEAIYKTLSLEGKSEKDLLEAMHKHPNLIERPIVVCGEHAVLGRPPENVQALFG